MFWLVSVAAREVCPRLDSLFTFLVAENQAIKVTKYWNFLPVSPFQSPSCAFLDSSIKAPLVLHISSRCFLRWWTKLSGTIVRSATYTHCLVPRSSYIRHAFPSTALLRASPRSPSCNRPLQSVVLWILPQVIFTKCKPARCGPQPFARTPPGTAGESWRFGSDAASQRGYQSAAVGGLVAFSVYAESEGYFRCGYNGFVTLAVMFGEHETAPCVTAENNS